MLKECLTHSPVPKLNRSAGSSKDDFPLVQLTVVSGPDAGLSRSFRKHDISIGRDASNDFVLSDGFVSNRHGVIDIASNDLKYRDVKSRHGSLVMVNNVSTHLTDQTQETTTRVGHGAELQLGCSVIKLILPENVSTGPKMAAQTERNMAIEVPTRRQQPGRAPDRSGKPPGRETREQLITASHEPVSSISERFASNDTRLELLFRLAGQLNASTSLDDVLDLVVEATFEAFPAANFFAITLVDDEGKPADVPLLTRVRGELADDDDEELILSSSILNRVIESRESVLFVKDSLGADVSQSILDARITACLCSPLVGQRSLLGVMEVDTRGRGSMFSKQDLDLFSILASNVAFAVERAKLADNIVQMFESFVEASVTAIEARDPTTAGHSQRVASYTLELAQTVNDVAAGPLKDIFLGDEELTELRYASLLHDFGKIAVREDVLQKATRLPEINMELVEQRFETIKALAHRTMMAKLTERAVSEGKPISAAELDEVRSRYRAVEDDIARSVAFLREVSAAGFVTDEQIARVRKLGQRHYVGADGVRRPFLTDWEIENLTIQKGTLNEAEWDNMRSHALRSEQYLERIPWGDELKNVPCIAGAHHEKLDGSGYPRGLKAEDIIPQVRMMTISDIFDALTASDRPYRKAATVDRALKILHLEADDGKLDRDLVGVFEELVIPRIVSQIPSLQ
jgi:3',5'-cyclic-nucleotide phosphodiesterase